ncbi:alpha-glucosidase [Pseudoflavonifractor sp. 524-17]|uniref:alpha-glucosidase n=1 Tax=Pseudoflavonifractor sp. 524-17 TaxID=2304577 RepID=UPI00137B77C5|nr:alpha-glucosidase [Pseudoflavonifractor sp. 524-17]NCE65069.1 alpha-glucosidase [Pseudoflavonifractor sp. 524-17]
MKHKQDWFKELVIYQIYPRSFQDSNGDGVGDLKGVLQRLDYLAELGVNALWLSPVYASPNVDNGYDVSDYRQIMPEFGTMDDWDALLAEAHRRGMALIMDLVLNHTSDQHPWFQSARQSRDSPYSGFYIWRDPVNGGPPNGWRAVFGGSAWEYVPERGQYYLHSFAKEQPDLNWEDPQVRAAVHDIVRWWADKGVDGFRVDAISYLDKHLEALDPGDGRICTAACTNLPGTHRYIRELVQATCAPDHLMTVGEVTCLCLEDHWDYTARSRGEFDMAIPFVSPIEELQGWSPRQMRAQINAVYQKLRLEGWWARFLSNHDKPRQVSLYGDAERHWEASAKLLAALLHTLPGTPFIYQGEEIGMTNIALPEIGDYDDIDTQNLYRSLVAAGVEEKEALRRAQLASRDNARTPMQWDSSSNAGFSTGAPWLPINPNYTAINAAEQRGRQDSIFTFYQTLIRLRREHPVLIHGDYTPVLEEDDNLFAYLRRWEGTTWAVIHNFGPAPQRVPLDRQNLSGKAVLSNCGRSGELEGEIILEPYESLILELDS